MIELMLRMIPVEISLIYEANCLRYKAYSYEVAPFGWPGAQKGLCGRQVGGRDICIGKRWKRKTLLQMDGKQSLG